jgi:parvulin-like peptidyl-prolyl isomerase
MQFNFKLKKGEINKASFLKNLIYVNKSIVRMQKLSDSEAIELAKNILENLNKKIGRFNKSLTL